MADTKHLLRVFLCHASGDKPVVNRLYERLVEDGVDAWLDKEKLIPGQVWQAEISKAVKNSDVVIVCLSIQSVTKEGFVQKEIKVALDAADEKPDETIFIIPARLENCEVPDRFSRYHWVDLFSDDGYEKLVKALQVRANSLGVTLKRKRRTIKNKFKKEIDTSIHSQDRSSEIATLAQDDSPKADADKKVLPLETVGPEKRNNFFVFFADEKKAKSITKLILFNDVGSLKIEGGRVKFNGLWTSINFFKIKRVSIVKNTIPWVTLFLSNAFSIILLIAFLVFVYYTNDQTQVFTLSSLMLFMFAIVFSLIVSNVISVFMMYAMKWVKIDFIDEVGRHRSAYFSDARFLGYSIFLGETEKLYRILMTQKIFVPT